MGWLAFRVLKEARFDRHFVRDLVWSRHQLEDLAERRWRACQASDPSKNEDDTPRFADLFSKVGAEDFSSSLAKLHTPRELLIMMTEMLARIEAHNDGEYVVAAQDMVSFPSFVMHVPVPRWNLVTAEVRAE
jgi:hypothetical protein